MKLTKTHETILIFLVALHSAIIGVVFMFAPNWLMQFGGWEGIDPVFFGRQAGAFHLVLAIAYLIEYFNYGGIKILLMAKSFALVFLLICTQVDPLPWAVPVSGLGDGLMALFVWWVHRQVATGKQQPNVQR